MVNYEILSLCMSQLLNKNISTDIFQYIKQFTDKYDMMLFQVAFYSDKSTNMYWSSFYDDDIRKKFKNIFEKRKRFFSIAYTKVMNGNDQEYNYVRKEIKRTGGHLLEQGFDKDGLFKIASQIRNKKIVYREKFSPTFIEIDSNQFHIYKNEYSYLFKNGYKKIPDFILVFFKRGESVPITPTIRLLFDAIGKNQYRTIHFVKLVHASQGESVSNEILGCILKYFGYIK